MLHFALCMSMFVCLEIKIFVFVFVNVYIVNSHGTQTNVHYTGCSPKRGEICSCRHVPELQCTDIKTVLSLLIKGLIRWQSHFP